MDFDWLQTFVTAAGEGNLRRTADKLHLAQPTVTQHIQKLEAACGFALFDRVGRQVVLNPAGRRFRTYADEILRRFNDGLEDLARLHQGYDVSLTILCSPLIATTYLPRWVQGYRAEHPNVEFDIEIVDSHAILDRLLDGRADLAFTRIPFVHAHVTTTALYADPVVMVAPRSRTDMDEVPQSGEEWLQRQVVFTHCHPGYWDDLVVKLRQMVPAVRTLKVSQVHVALHWVAEHMGVSFLPTSTIRRDVLRGTVEEIPCPWLQLPIAQTYLLEPQEAGYTACEFARYVEAYMEVRSV